MSNYFVDLPFPKSDIYLFGKLRVYVCIHNYEYVY